MKFPNFRELAALGRAPRLRTVSGALAACLTLAASGALADLSPEVLEACRSELPDKLAEAAEPGAVSGRGDGGEWSVTSAQMDGSGGEEAILVLIRAGRGAKAWFVAERDGKDPTRKKISLKGPPAPRISVAFPPFADGTALAHVDGGEGGQVLLHWHDGKLKEIWKVGRTAADEDYWFEIEDLDADGVPEVIVFFRRELDIYTDDEVISESSGADDQTMSSGKIDAMAVHRWNGSKWKKDKQLLESLH